MCTRSLDTNRFRLYASFTRACLLTVCTLNQLTETVKSVAHPYYGPLRWKHSRILNMLEIDLHTAHGLGHVNGNALLKSRVNARCSVNNASVSELSTHTFGRTVLNRHTSKANSRFYS